MLAPHVTKKKKGGAKRRNLQRTQCSCAFRETQMRIVLSRYFFFVLRASNFFLWSESNLNIR